ncbi:MAG: tRNA (5-methylaminomethyl-2-thiouridine)(34)-methyltransferase MnmD [Candidatus Kapaibacteriales bacterium]
MKDDISVIKTGDGSNSLYLPELDETFHSRGGAYTEAMHVYIDAGLNFFIQNNPEKKDINILELGFGSGLNTVLTFSEFSKNNFISESKSLYYTSIDKYPLSKELLKEYWSDKKTDLFNLDSSIIDEILYSEWEKPISINNSKSDNFKLKKVNSDIDSFLIEDSSYYDIVYWDAFAPSRQPELWSEEIFTILRKRLNHGAVLTTYASASLPRKNLQNAGFAVSKIPGPPFKREMIRADVN